MEPDKEVMSRLKFIGKVQKGEKINVKYMFIQPEGIITRISRTIINQDCRENTLNFVRNTITSTFQIINIYSSSTKDSQKHICLNIIQDLKHSTKGITNLKNTYRDDVKLGCDLDTLLQEIDAFLVEINVNEQENGQENETSV
jgi:hypothetical protein